MHYNSRSLNFNVVVISEYNETEEATVLQNDHSSAMFSFERDLRRIDKHPETIGEKRINLQGSSFLVPERRSAGPGLV